MQTPEIVLLGGPNSGKTHFAGQLYGRLQRHPGVLKLRKDLSTPPDLSALEEVLSCLENGSAATHTSTDTWAEILLPLVDEQQSNMDLHWPDYGGEQLKAVFKDREVQDNWRKKLTDANGWILLIRLKSEITYPDALEDLTKNTSEQNQLSKRATEWDANAYWVELLQILLHVAGVATVSKTNKPRLAIMLSCYDELNVKSETPEDILTQKLPLLSSFILSNWNSQAVSIWGLSSLGRALDSKSCNDAFIDDGPEYQGWVINPGGGEPDSDLSKPLAWLLDNQND